MSPHSVQTACSERLGDAAALCESSQISSSRKRSQDLFLDQMFRELLIRCVLALLTP